MNLIQRMLLVLAFPFLLAAPLEASLVFNFDGGDNNLSTISKTVSGVTLTLSNPSPDATFPADGDGLGVFTDSSFGNITSFDMSFSHPVTLVSYTIGYVDALEGDESITLASAGGASSIENGFVNGGGQSLSITEDFANQFSVAAGEIISVTGNVGGLGTDLIQWKQLTVDMTAVPEPDSSVFTFNGADNNLSTISKTVSGVTLTLSNPSTDGTFPADADGLGVFTDGGFGNITSFDMSFSHPVTLVSYTIGYVDALEGDESITLASASGASSVENGFVNGGGASLSITRDFTNQFSVAAGEIISVTGNIGGLGTDLIQWKQLTVDTTAVPEPPGLTRMVEIANASFEAGTPPSVPGWNLNPALGGADGGANANAQFGPDFDFARDGNQWLYQQLPGFGGPATSVAHSDVVGTAMAGSYTLRVAGGHRPNDFTTDGAYQIELLAGNTVIASESLEDPHSAIPLGQWTDIVARAVLRGGNPAIGQDLSIRLTTLNGSGESPHHQGQFDDVRLDFNPPNIRIAQANTWHLLTVPANAPTDSTMGDLVVADSLPAPAWLAFKYNATAQPPRYEPLLADTAVPPPGTGFWFLSTESLSLAMPSDSAPNTLQESDCAVMGSAEKCYKLSIPSDDNWHLVGNPLDSTIHIDDIAVTPEASAPARLIFQYDTYKQGYVPFDTQGVKIARPWQGYWWRFESVSTPSEWTVHQRPYSVSIPEMVHIPAPQGGLFTIGSPVGEPGRFADENQAQVNLGTEPFRMGRHEVTFAQYDAFVAATGRNDPSDEGWGKADRPVMNVNWDDATAYAVWLSDQTGHQYRLPSEAQWEYAARAGTTSAYHTGDSITAEQANFRGSSAQPLGVNRQKTVPVGTLDSANDFGLYDMLGNVFEWTCSAYQSVYGGVDGEELDCAAAFENRSVRGGAWNSTPVNVRSAYRGSIGPGTAASSVGFRLAQD